MLIVRVQPFGSLTGSRHEVLRGPFDIGRSLAADEVPRCVVVGDPSVSRNHARLLEEPDGQLRVTNTSQRMGIATVSGVIEPGESRVLKLPAALKIGDTDVNVERVSENERVPTPSLAALQIMASLGTSPLLEPQPERITTTSAEHDPAIVARWFETLIAVQRAPAGSKEFYSQTARALVDLIGMDIGLVLLLKPGGWEVTARHASEASERSSRHRGREFSATVLDHIAREKRTMYHTDDVPATESLAEVNNLVASPVLLPNGDVAGALYGVRHTILRGRSLSISALEAQMVQVLATAVGIGLARVAQEEEAARLRVQLHQQFNDRLASELESDLGRLDPQDREISILFADIRGFSHISEKLGAAETFQLVSEVMEVMTESVKRHDGAIMDYVGDELIAIWNAPADHADHARLAVGCAAELSGDLAGVSAAWQSRLGQPVSIGIGVNSGTARVGNTGTRSKPKYGALGHTVNVASRVQGATKAFGCPILLTGSTRDRLPADSPARRLGKVKVLGINEPVELYQPLNESAGIPADVLGGYDAALAHFESGNLTETALALRALGKIPEARTDGATLLLVAKVKALIRAEVKDYAPVIELSSK